MQSVVGVAMLRHSRLLAFMNNLKVAYYVKSIPCWQNLSKKFRETSLTQVNDVKAGNGQDAPEAETPFLTLELENRGRKYIFQSPETYFSIPSLKKSKKSRKMFF